MHANRTLVRSLSTISTCACVALAALGANSCAMLEPTNPVRASSIPILGAQASTLRVDRPLDVVLAKLGPLFDKRGDHLIGSLADFLEYCAR